MADKRKFHHFLNTLKEKNIDNIGIIESIQQKFESDISSISDSEIKSLKQFPEQYVKRIPIENQEWTSQLHIWAEHGVPEILELDPVLLSFKNSSGDTVLMSLISGATGAYTDVVNYDLIEQILNKNLEYEDVVKDPEGNDVKTTVSVLNIKDLNEQTPIEFLIDFAFNVENYKDSLPDLKLQQILKDFSHRETSHL